MKITNALLFLAVFAGAEGGAMAQQTDVAGTVMERTGKRLPEEAGGQARDVVKQLLKQRLTADSAAQIALLNNQSLQATLDEIGISQADLREAGLLKNPVFVGSARIPDRPPSGADIEGEIAQDFLDLLVMPLRKRVAAAQLEQTKLRVANEVLELAVNTKIAFYEVQAQGQLLAQMKLVLETSRAAIELAQKQHKAGNISDLVLANQQAAYSQNRLEVAMAEAEVREKREKLNRLMGVWGDGTAWKVAETLPQVPDADFPARGLEALAVEQRLDLAAAHAQLASVVNALGLTKNYRFIGALEIGIDSERSPDRQTVTGPTLKLELPVFNQGQARVAKGEAQLRQAEHRFEALAIEIRSEVREKRDALIAKRDVAKFYREELLPERAQILSLTQLQYNGMLLGAYDLLLAKRDALETERGEIEATRDYWIARAELERAVGGGLGVRKQTAAFKEIKTSSKLTHKPITQSITQPNTKGNH